MQIHKYVYICTHKHTYIYVEVPVYSHFCKNECLFKYLYGHLHALYIYICIHKHTHAPICIYYVCVCILTYTDWIRKESPHPLPFLQPELKRHVLFFFCSYLLHCTIPNAAHLALLILTCSPAPPVQPHLQIQTQPPPKHTQL